MKFNRRIEIKVSDLMDKIQREMFQKANDDFQNKVKEASDWKTFMSLLNNANVVLTPWFILFLFYYVNFLWKVSKRTM